MGGALWIAVPSPRSACRRVHPPSLCGGRPVCPVRRRVSPPSRRRATHRRAARGLQHPARQHDAGVPGRQPPPVPRRLGADDALLLGARGPRPRAGDGAAGGFPVSRRRPSRHGRADPARAPPVGGSREPGPPVSPGTRRVRHQGRHRSVSRLAARRAPRGAKPRLRAHVGRHDHHGLLRPGAIHSAPGSSTALVGTAADGAGHGRRAGRHRLRHGAARREADPRVFHHRERRHHHAGLWRGTDRHDARPSRARGSAGSAACCTSGITRS